MPNGLKRHFYSMIPTYTQASAIVVSLTCTATMLLGKSN